MPDDIEPATGQEVTTEPAAEAPKPTETVEFWKQKAREQEARAKSNADAARRVQELEDAQKSETQKLADAAARSAQEAAEARAEMSRYKVAAAHGVTEDYFDLLGSGDEATITARAEKIKPLLSLAAENEQLKAELDALKAGKPAPTNSRPVAALKPGASPEGSKTSADEAYEAIFGAN